MAKQDTSQFPRQGRAPSAVVSGGRDNKTGRETWHIASKAGRRTVTTSASSAAVMDEAMVIYAKTIKRLADR